jgi:hypothetical protein
MSKRKEVTQTERFIYQMEAVLGRHFAPDGIYHGVDGAMRLAREIGGALAAQNVSVHNFFDLHQVQKPVTKGYVTHELIGKFSDIWIRERTQILRPSIQSCCDFICANAWLVTDGTVCCALRSVWLHRAGSGAMRLWLHAVTPHRLRHCRT